MDQFIILEKQNYKHYFIAPDDDGHWTLKILKPPFDWKGTIQNETWIKEIALESRRIAEKEQKAISIMWLIGVSKKTYSRHILPWYHEGYNPKKTNRAATHRTKTPFDESLIIRTSEDLEKLRLEANKAKSSVRRIRIQPQEEKLLRDKDTLRFIGELSKNIGAIILLEGGVLSHAYYQLMETNATVEVLYPFRDIEDKREFYKLVRDKVPSNIQQGGEIVRTTQLSSESLLRAFREKLIEEAFEVLDSIDQDSIVDELADVNEIIDGILAHLEVGKDELLLRQKIKRESTGGFKDGIILLETQNPLPTKKDSEIDSNLFDNLTKGTTSRRSHVDDPRIIELGHKIDKWSDRRDHQTVSEAKLRFVVPVVRNDWATEVPETIVDLNSQSGVSAKITGTRLGSKLQIEISVFTKVSQFKLPFDSSNSVKIVEE